MAAVLALATALLGSPFLAGAVAGGALAAGRTIRPANPHATEDAKKVLAYLYHLPERSDKRLISGHFAAGSLHPGIRGDYHFTLKEFEYLQRVSGQWPALMGADYCAGWVTAPDPMNATMYYKDVNAGLIAHWKAGGLVTITLHQFDPRLLHKGGGRGRYIDWPEKDRLDISKLYTPGGEEYTNFRMIMDRWAEGLQELQDNGVVVFWRPFNEATNSRKWWCRQPADQFIALYRYTFDYMTNAKRLNNLLWVYDAVDKTANKFELSHYPGDDYVDIVGITLGWDQGPAPQPAHPYPKKVFACVEFNVPDTTRTPTTIQRDYDYRVKLAWLKKNIPYASYFMSWDRAWGPYGCGTPESVNALYNDPWVVNRDEVDWRKQSADPRR